MRAVLFGAGGQDGYYLTNLLAKNGVEVITSSRSSLKYQGDVGDYSFVHSIIERFKPAYIFHLAAESSTRHDTLFLNHNAISTGTINILEATRLLSPEARVFLSGSAMQFRNEGLPIDEGTPFDASSPYSVSRIQSVYAARYFQKEFGLKTFVGYFFNHDSPLRSERHVNQKIVQSVKRISEKKQSKLQIGNTDVRKEFNYAADLMEAVWILVNQDQHYEAVLGNGQAYRILDWIECCFEIAGLRWQDYVEEIPGYVTEYNTLVSNPERIRSMGWESKVSMEQLAALMWNTQA